MPTAHVSAVRPSIARRSGQIVTGLAALIVLLGLLVGAPVALVAFAGNPLPDHLPGMDEITTTLTSRDDGQLFLRALAIVGWAGWATFALSVLVELPARVRRRPAPRLPGLSRQQRAVAALVGSVALIIAASPAASAASRAASVAAVAPYRPPVAAQAALLPTGSTPGSVAGSPVRWSVPVTSPRPEPVPVYRVERDDYLGHIADRYLGDFDRYRDLARLNKIRDPNRIRPGQLLRLPDEAADRGVRKHATGLVAVPPSPGNRPATPPAPRPTVPRPTTPPATSAPDGETPRHRQPDEPTLAAGAARSSELSQVNRPLAVSAVISVAGIIGAQIGAVLGLRRRSTAGKRSTASTRSTVGSRSTAESRAPEVGRHRRN